MEIYQTEEEYIKYGNEFMLSRENLIKVHLKPNSTTKRELVYICLHNYQCGNLASMMMAITQGLLLADITNRNFQICVFEPCQFQHLYLPVSYNWTCTHMEMYWNEPDFFSKNVYFTKSGTLVENVLKDENRNSIFYTVTESFLKDISKIPNLPRKWAQLSQVELYQTLHGLIFYKSNFLASAVNRALRDYAGELKCLSVEIGKRTSVTNFIYSRLPTFVQWMVDVTPDIEIVGVWELDHDTTVMVATNSEEFFKASEVAFEKTIPVSNSKKEFKLNFLKLEQPIGKMDEADAKCEHMERSVIEFEVSKNNVCINSVFFKNYIRF